MKNKIVYISIFLCLAGLAVAAEYTDWQNGAIDGFKKGFEMGQAYQLALDGKNIDGFNAKVDEYNAWVRANFGEDPNMLMPKMTAPVDLSKPVLITNTTTSSKGAKPRAASCSRWSARRRSASRPECTAGCRVFTRPSSASAKPVTSATSVTACPASRMV